MAPSPQAPRAPTALGGQSGCESRAGQGSGAGVWRSPVLEQAVGGTRYMVIPMLTYINVHMPPSAEREESGPPSRGGATGNGWSTLQ